jgi:hypothetical protein
LNFAKYGNYNTPLPTIYIYTFDYKVSKIGHDIYNVGPLFSKMVYEPMNTIVTSIIRHSYCCYNPA